MAAASIVESSVRYREANKKWKDRWCVLKKPSPVADCLSVVLYKDHGKASVKSNLTLDEFCGIDTTQIDGEKFVLSVVCCSRTVSLAFNTKELRDQWREKLFLNFGEDIRFEVELTHGLSSELKSSSSATNVSTAAQHCHHHHFNSCNLFMTPLRLSLTTTAHGSGSSLKHLCSWKYTDLRKCGPLGENVYGIQVSMKEGEKNYVFRTSKSVEIDKALKNRVNSLMQSCGLFEQLLCSVAATNTNAFATSASNPSTPTLCTSSDSTRVPRPVDRRLSNPNSRFPFRSYGFSQSIDNSFASPPCGNLLGGCLGSVSQQSLMRHYSECSLNMSGDRALPRDPETGSMVLMGATATASCSAFAKESNREMSKSNYVNFDGKTTGESLTNGPSVYLQNDEEDKRGLVRTLPPKGCTNLRSLSQHGGGKEIVKPKYEEIFYNESSRSRVMMNGGFCGANAFRPLPYIDMSQYDGEPDEGYLYWVSESAGHSSKSQSSYVNVQGMEMKHEGRRNSGEYLKPKKSSLHLRNSSYVNVSGVEEMKKMIKTMAEEETEADKKDAAIEEVRTTSGFDQNVTSDYIPLSQLSSDKGDLVIHETSEDSQVLELIPYDAERTPIAVPNVYSGEPSSQDDPVDGESVPASVFSEESVLINQNNGEGNRAVVIPAETSADFVTTPKAVYQKDVIRSNELDINEDLRKKILLSPPPAPVSRGVFECPNQSQEYINLTSVTSLVTGDHPVPSPPPRPPKTLNSIREDVSESCLQPPPLPDKVNCSKGSTSHSRRKDYSFTLDPKPPLPRRSCQSSVNLHSSPPPGNLASLTSQLGSLHLQKRCSASSFSGGRPVSASSLVSRHRKPNLTVDLKNITDLETGSSSSSSIRTSDSPSIGFHSGRLNEISTAMARSKQSLDELNRSLPALATYKPRNGKEYLDRRRLAEDGCTLPPYTPQRSPSLASTVFNFDERSVSSTFNNYNSSGEDSPKCQVQGIPSVRNMFSNYPHQKRFFMGRDKAHDGSPGFCHFHESGLESPHHFFSSDTNESKINYADIDHLPSDFAGSGSGDPNRQRYVKTLVMHPPSSPHVADNSKTVYAKIDVAATSAASLVGKQHAKQREHTLEKRTAEVTASGKQQVFDNLSMNSNLLIDRCKLSLDVRKTSNVSIKD